VIVSTGRFFDGRYLVDVIVIAVQLPVAVINMNSLDNLPNFVGPGSCINRAKRAKTVPLSGIDSPSLLFHQGQAFTATLVANLWIV
jgi:hypothetical protein